MDTHPPRSWLASTGFPLKAQRRVFISGLQVLLFNFISLPHGTNFLCISTAAIAFQILGRSSSLYYERVLGLSGVFLHLYLCCCNPLLELGCFWPLATYTKHTRKQRATVVLLTLLQELVNKCRPRKYYQRIQVLEQSVEINYTILSLLFYAQQKMPIRRYN